MANIFQIEEDILRAYQTIEDNDGEVNEEIIEKLSISKDNLKSKISSYAGAIKNLQADQSLIKEEISRLKALYESKSKTIDWLKQTMMNAIEQFGDTTKSGGKFIDYGTGKVSVSIRQVVDVNKDEIEEFSKRLIRGFSWYNMQNQLSKEFVNADSLLEFANDEEDTSKLTIKDLEYLNAKIKLNLNLADMLDDEKGFNVIKALIQYNNFDIDVDADKKAIKDGEKIDGWLPSYSEMKDNKSVTIK